MGYANVQVFAQSYAPTLKLNETFSTASSQTINLAGVGTFQNRNVELTWQGLSHRNGTDCALIGYQAFFNPVAVKGSAFQMIGRSHYWGEIWVGLHTGDVEFGTLNEDVLGTVTMVSDTAPIVVNVLRSGRLEPL